MVTAPRHSRPFARLALSARAVLCILVLSTVLGCAAGPAPAAAHPRVVFKTSLGSIVVELYPEKAPVTVANFLAYVDEGRYRRATFYRVVTPGNQPDNDVRIEVIQGGLSMEDEHPGRLPAIAHETTRETGLKHGDGALSMARDEPGTATSEFFITVGSQPELDHGGRRNPDGQGFAVFGRVVEGMDVVREIQRRPETGQMLDAPVPITVVRRLPPR